MTLPTPTPRYILRLTGTKGVGVETLEEAARAFAPFTGRGSAFYGRWKSLGAILDGTTGEQVARCSPNGRVWPVEKWTPNQKPLAEAAL